MRKMGLEPTRHECHKILSLARLPVPTLPHSIFFVAIFITRADHKWYNTIHGTKCQLFFLFFLNLFRIIFFMIRKFCSSGEFIQRYIKIVCNSNQDENIGKCNTAFIWGDSLSAQMKTGCENVLFDGILPAQLFYVFSDCIWHHLNHQFYSSTLQSLCNNTLNIWVWYNLEYG